MNELNFDDDVEVEVVEDDRTFDYNDANQFEGNDYDDGFGAMNALGKI